MTLPTLSALLLQSLCTPAKDLAALFLFPEDGIVLLPLKVLYRLCVHQLGVLVRERLFCFLNARVYFISFNHKSVSLG